VGSSHTDDLDVSTESRWPPGIEEVSSAQLGDRQQLGRILGEGYPRVMAFLLGMGLDQHMAEEIAAETCEAVVTGLPRLRSPQAFEAWFWAVVRNRLRSGFRKRRRVEPNSGLIPPPTPDETVVEREEHLRIRMALARLTPRDRELLWLREVELLSYEEIGNRLSAAVGTVRVACHRARRRLEEIYREGED
jgi:RNA polymerase sigma-70 factor (ECF subfamily)